MKSFFPKLFLVLLLSFGIFFQTGANFWDTSGGGGSLFGGDGELNPYCSSGDCGLQQGIDGVAGSVVGLEINRSFSDYIQDVVVYLLGFLSIIAVIYIIYAGFTLLISGGNEEKMTSTKNTILYVVIGLAIIWLAGPITTFIFRVLNAQ